MPTDLGQDGRTRNRPRSSREDKRNNKETAADPKRLGSTTALTLRARLTTISKPA
jgi:hypothetical protein